MQHTETTSYLDELFRNMPYTMLGDGAADIPPSWMAHPDKPQYNASTQSATCHPLGPHSLAQFNYAAIELSPRNSSTTEPSGIATPDALSSGVVAEKDPAFDFFVVDISSTHADSANSCASSPFWKARYREATSPGVLGTQLECTLCNKKFSSQALADACFLGHLGIKPFPCFGTCGDGQW
jgi:hypothetical protein